MGHGITVFPGGVGTAEEIRYLRGILLHPDNAGIPFPLILTGPTQSAAYFEQIDRFSQLTLGAQVAQRYQVIIDDPAAVARRRSGRLRARTEGGTIRTSRPRNRLPGARNPFYRSSPRGLRPTHP